MANEQAFKTVFRVTRVGNGVRDYATVGKHIAFYDCAGELQRCRVDGFATVNNWARIPLTYQNGQLTGVLPGPNRQVSFDFDESSKLLTCHMPNPGAGKSVGAMVASTTAGNDEEWVGEPD